MYEILIALFLLSAGDYSQRVQAEHDLKTSNVSFEFAKACYNIHKDPEFKYRMKRVLWVIWCIETSEKYESDGNYYNHPELMDNLRRLDFNKMFEKSLQ